MDTANEKLTAKMFIGIDPGLKGAIAYIVPGHAVAVIKMPKSLQGILQIISHTLSFPYEAFVTIEQVHASPQMGVSSAFTFGKHVGQLETVLEESGAKYSYVTPQKWQTALNCLTHGDKNLSLSRARQLFQDVEKLSKQTADALLIAYYGYMKNGK